MLWLTWTQSSPMTKMRKPFLAMAKGMTNTAKKARRQGECKKRFPASRLVISKTWLEWMPLHSGPTLRLKLVGRLSISPSWTQPVPARLNKPWAAAVEVCWKKLSIPLFTTSG